MGHLVTDRNMNPATVIKTIQSEYLHLLKQHLTSELREYLPLAAAATSFMRGLYIQPDPAPILEIPRPGAPSLSPADYRTQRLVNDIIAFWLRNGDRMLDAIAHCKGFATSIFAESTPLEQFKKYGLYFDMVCIEDRIFGDAAIAKVHDVPIGPYLYGGFRGKYLGLLLLEPLLAANTDPPLVVVYPDPHSLALLREGPQALSSTFTSSVNQKTLSFFQRLFPSITTPEELFALFGRRLEKETLRVLDNCSFLREMSGGHSVQALAQRYALQTTMEASTETSVDFASLGDEYVGWNVFRAVNTKIHHQERVNLFFNRCSVDPLLDDLSWPLFKWDLESQAHEAARQLGLSEELAIPRIMEKPALKWLGNVDIEHLVEIHQTDKLTELRQVFADYRKEIRFADPLQFDRVFERVAQGINAAIDEYGEVQKSAIRKITLKRGVTYATFIVSGALSIASIACPALLPLAVASAAVGVTVGSSIANLVDDQLSARRSRKELAARPLGILLKIKLKGEQTAIVGQGVGGHHN